MDILKPLANKNLAVSFSCFCMRGIISPSLEPVVQRAISSAYVDSWTPFIGLAILFMIMKKWSQNTALRCRFPSDGVGKGLPRLSPEWCDPGENRASSEAFGP